MKYNNIKIGLYSFLLLIFISLSACNSFLDDMPDNRAEIKGPKEIKDILVSAYTNLHPQLIFEKMSDNVRDNGALHGTESNLNQDMYFWLDTNDNSWDSPFEIWSGAYLAIANANQALEKIEALGFPDETRGSRAEALLCRAYHHFLLSTVFCMAYDESTAADHLGLPYMREPEKEAGVKYQRGTLKELYDNINDDIEQALKDIAHLEFDVPLYHFNKNAAYAFATRFNLFYKKDQETLTKVLKYASEVLGNDAFSVLRDFSPFSSYTKGIEWTYGYMSKNERANLLLITNRTMWARAIQNPRYGHAKAIAEESTFRSYLPAGSPTVYNLIFGGDQTLIMPKMYEIFEYTDVIARTGQPHVVVPAFTTDETLLCRAEAYTLLNRFDEATTDLKTWYKSKGCSGADVIDTDSISRFYSTADVTTVAKPLNPKFKIDEGVQTNLLHAILHARRIEGIHEGIRFFDIKRYGIEIEHNRANDTPIVLKAHDLRKAVQIPKMIQSAGFQPNPR